MVLAEAFSDAGKRVITLENEYVKKRAMLNRNYFTTAKNDLITGSLIRATRAGKTAYRYEWLNQDGAPLSDTSKDSYGLVSESVIPAN
jgi:hypothetical protein